MFKKRAKPTPVRRTRVQPSDSSASKIFSYRSVQRPVDDNGSEKSSARHVRGEEVAKKDRSLFMRRLGAFVLFLLIVGIVLYNARLSTANVHVIVKGTPEQRLLLQDTATYTASIQEIMDEKIQNRTKFTFNSESLTNEMARRFPEIAKVDVSLPLFGSNPQFYIEPSSAALLFVAKDNKAYVINNEGRIISNNTANTPQGIPSVHDQSNISPRMGMQVLPSSDVAAIQTILSQLKEKGIAVDALVLPTAAQRLEVRLQGKPYYVKFTLHENVMQQVGAYIAVQRKLDQEGVQPHEYVDARVADRVYYK